MPAGCIAGPTSVASWTHQPAVVQCGVAGGQIPALPFGGPEGVIGGNSHIRLQPFSYSQKLLTTTYNWGRLYPALGPNGRGSVQANLFGFGGKTSKGSGGRQGCAKCGYKGSVECPGCKGSGKNKKNGNMFERYKCFDCQGFGLISCPACSKGKGLTPEQRGER
ncbi:hypothetical protein KFL_002640070 [Klebsormidium nitens]|uniref:Uncharacterized protein n=1 Tax=Klebsormidium nitens TaxID=105231 RepID=A0A0U9HTD7_KLENI|nr:hypothetical protein KFL_002640070 [Klebsormidium nitens]|eukprot:GAQ85985.1 hypothetical protein KFL_002640070 [Klebsormidium nitens]